MMDRLMSRADEEGVDNITPMLSAWPLVDSDRRFDIVISTLCPGSSSPESIMRMEELSNGPCIIITWHRNHGDDMLSEVRSILGLPDPLLNRGNGKAYGWLVENGREAEMYTLEGPVHYDADPEDMISDVVRDLGTDVDENTYHMISQCVYRHVVNGRFRIDVMNSIDVIIWNEHGCRNRDDTA
jgi:hypothetical protein